MFGFKYFKGSPTSYHFHFKGSEVRRQGPGLSFVYWRPTSTIVAVPMETQDIPFAFTQPTKDFQDVTVQGQVTFRVVNPEKLSKLMDFTVNEAGAYTAESPALLNERIGRVVQIATKDLIQEYDLKKVLDKSDLLSRQVLERVRNEALVQMLGLEVLSTAIHALSPNPEMGRALEAAAREALQGESDQAMYIRRNAVVEQERTIKENELRTEIAVEQKRRQIRETKLQADIAIEEAKAKADIAREEARMAAEIALEAQRESLVT
ncbi:MAG: SPFH domain-containing protein, partial [Bdellovibrionia bacterium]